MASNQFPRIPTYKTLTMADHWENVLKTLHPITDAEAEEMRIAFYAGARSFLFATSGVTPENPEPTMPNESGAELQAEMIRVNCLIDELIRE